MNLGIAELCSHFVLNTKICTWKLIIVRGYHLLWTGLGAQLARDVPFSAICWTVLEPVRYCLSDAFYVILWLRRKFQFNKTC